MPVRSGGWLFEPTRKVKLTAFSNSKLESKMLHNNVLSVAVDDIIIALSLLDSELGDSYINGMFYIKAYQKVKNGKIFTIGLALPRLNNNMTLVYSNFEERKIHQSVMNNALHRLESSIKIIDKVRHFNDMPIYRKSSGFFTKKEDDWVYRGVEDGRAERYVGFPYVQDRLNRMRGLFPGAMV